MLHRRRKKIAQIAFVIFWAATVLNAVAAVGSKLPAWEFGGAPWESLRAFGARWGAIAVCVFTALIGVSALVIRWTGRQPTWETLHALLNGLRAAIFRNGDIYDNPDHHRVTIFRAVPVAPCDPWWTKMIKCCANQPRWLVPVVRSHHTSQATSVCFRLHDDGDRCEGVCGHAYVADQVVNVPHLPDVSCAEGPPSDRDIRSYAKQAFVSRAWIEERKPKTRSILALPLMVNGRPWGVLVFDSRNSEPIPYDELADIFSAIQTHITVLLSKHL